MIYEINCILFHQSAVLTFNVYDFHDKNQKITKAPKTDLSGSAVAGHLDPVLPPDDEDGDGEEDHHGQQNGCQNPGR